MLRLTSILLLFVLIWILFSEKAKSAPSQRTIRYTMKEILKMQGGWDLDSFRTGKFETDFDFEKAPDFHSFCQSKYGNVDIEWKQKKFTLKIGNLRFNLLKMRTNPNGDTISSSIVPDENLYQFVTGKDTFTYFHAQYFMCNGSGCVDKFHFLINHTLHSISIWEVYGFLLDENEYISDINNDSIPDFLWPHFATWHGGAFSDTTEILHLHPYISDTTGNYHPLLENKKEVRYSYAVDFQYWTSTDKIVRPLKR